MKRLLCLCLCLCICFGLLSVGASASVDVRPESLEPQAPVSAIVTLTPEADRNAVIALLDPGETVTQRYDALLYGFAVSTVNDRLEDLRALPGVEAVYRGNTYSYAPMSELSDYEIVLQTISATTVNASTAWEAGYQGQGMVIAVLDTGFYLDHEAFAVYPELLGAVGMSKSHASNLISRLHRGEWVSDKVPFAWDYTKNSGDVTDLDGHGTHVAGLAVGYAENALGELRFSGTAPAAQLVAMKVFADDDEGVDTATLFQALEDAYLLDVDVINMSLGSVNGFSVDPDTFELEQNVYEELEDAGIVVCCAAGNEGNMGYEDDEQYAVSSSYPDYGVIGNPASLPQCVSIASLESSYYLSDAIQVGQEGYSYADGSGENLFYDAFYGSSLTYVVIPGLGAEEDYQLEPAASTIARLNRTNTPWLAVVQRGELYFTEKLANAAAAGAAGMICYNNTDGYITMEIDEYPIPAVSVTQAAGQALIAQADSKGSGKLTICEDPILVASEEGGLMSTFSSWGTTSDLLVKPELTAPGGNDWSASISGEEAYITMSGTSMASPTASGAFACALQYLKANFPEAADKPARAKLALDLLESTAAILDDGYSFYSPRQQGAGQIDLEAALETKLFLSQPVVSLGDDPDRTGKLTLSYTVHNLAGSAQTCALDVLLLTSYAEEGYDLMFSDILDGMFSLSAAVNGAAASADALTLPKGTSTLTITLQLDQQGLDQMEASFPIGGFLEGFVCLFPQEGPMVHGTFVSFLGDWTQGSLLSPYDFSDVINSNWLLETTLYADYDHDPFLFQLVDGIPVVDEYGEYVYDPEGTPLSWADLGYTYWDYLDYMDDDEIPMTADLTWVYTAVDLDDELTITGILGDNPEGMVPYLADRNALSAAESDQFVNSYFMLFPGQLRNARRVILLIYDAETGEIYSVDDLEYQPKLYYDLESGVWTQDVYFYWDLFNYNEDSPTYGEIIPDDTQVNVALYGWIDYDTATEQAFQDLPGEGYAKYAGMLTPEWDHALQLFFPVRIDSTAPQLSGSEWDPVTHRLSLTMTDDQYLAWVSLTRELDIQGQMMDLIIDTETFAEDSAGAVTTAVIDLDDYLDITDIPQTVVLTLGDYASNTGEATLTLAPVPYISAMAAAADGVSLNLQNAQAGTAVLAVYDAQGQLLDTISAPVASGQATVEFSVGLQTLDRAAVVTASLLNGALEPQCPAKTLALTGG